ncbi:MAG: hypothetical protein RL115_2192 [Bacteroidota bacterium]|jgi:hypothetical protein
MAEVVKIEFLFPKHLFWDMDMKLLDWQHDKDVIIPRALYMTNRQSFESDIKKLEAIYTPAQIVVQLKKTKELISNEVCDLVSQRYMIAPFYRFRKK